MEYRKSGLSLNHIQGCLLDCAYCIRHTYGLWDARQPRALMSDAEAVSELVNHRYFQPHVTPVQVFNRATDPFLPNVRPHTFSVLEDLDERSLTNHVLVIARHQMKAQDAERLNQFRHIKLTLLFTYSGIDDKRIEPYPSHVAAESLTLMSSPVWCRYRTVLYWRPLVSGLNDSDEHLHRAFELGQHADATVFTGLFYRDEIAGLLGLLRSWGEPAAEPPPMTQPRHTAGHPEFGVTCRRANPTEPLDITLPATVPRSDRPPGCLPAASFRRSVGRRTSESGSSDG